MFNSAEMTERQRMLFRCLLGLFTIAVYVRIAGNDFISFDDSLYIVDNPWLRKPWSMDSVRYMFSPEMSPAYWQPLTLFSLMLDYKLFGLNPAGYHLENLLIHTASSLLLLELLYRSIRKFMPAFMVAAIFAIHPVNVEVVAWAVERKTTLSLLLCFLMLAAYGWYVARPSAGRYSVMLLLFILGLMAKPILITVPVLLLLVDVWPLGRFSLASTKKSRVISIMILEKIPFAVLSCCSLLLSFASFSSTIEVAGRISDPIVTRIANALISYASYPLKLVWPASLSLYYPLLKSHVPWQVVLSLIALSVVTVAAITQFHRRPWFFCGWVWYVISLVPASGLLRRGLWPEMADRFIYLPELGLLVIAVWGIQELFQRSEATLAGIRMVFCSLLLAACAAITFTQIGAWRNSETIYSHSLSVTKNNDTMLIFLGTHYFKLKDYDRGIELIRQAVDINSNDLPMLQLYQGQLEMIHGDYDAAKRLFQAVINVRESNFQAILLLAQCYEKTGQIETALYNYNLIMNANVRNAQPYVAEAALKVESLLPKVAPDLDRTRKLMLSGASPEQIGDFALLLDRLGFFEEALTWYQKLERSMPGNWQVYYNMANVMKKLRRLDGAVVAYHRVQELNPSFKEACNNLGSVYTMQARYDSAIREFEKALRLDPAYGYAAYNRALALKLKKDELNAEQAFVDIERRFPELSDMARFELSTMKKK